MVKTDTLEGTIDEVLWYHYDLANDVLYLRMADKRDIATCAEETSDGYLLLRSQDTNETVGLTVVNWWERFGEGSLPDSLRELESLIEPWAKKCAA